MGATGRVGEVQVIGAEPPGTPRPATPRFLWLLAPVLAFLVAIIIVGRDRRDAPVSSTTVLTEESQGSRQNPTQQATTSLPPQTSSDADLEQLVPGFTDSLVIAVTTRLGDTRLLAWEPGNGPPSELTELPGFFALQPDLSGEVFAGLYLPGETRSETTLSLGDLAGRLTPIAVDTRGFAWHGSTAGRLAWLADLEDGTSELITREPDGTTTSIARLDSGLLATWGDWGFAIVIPSTLTSTELRSPDFEHTAEIPGHPVGSTYENQLVFTYGRGYPGDRRTGPVTFLVDPRTGNINPLLGVKDDEVVLDSQPAPDGSAVAVHVIPPQGILEGPFLRGSVRILNPAGDQLAEIDSNLAVAPMAWSSDSRFVVFPRSTQQGRFELLFYDIKLKAITAVESEAFGRMRRFPLRIIALGPD